MPFATWSVPRGSPPPKIEGVAISSSAEGGGSKTRPPPPAEAGGSSPEAGTAAFANYGVLLARVAC
eukprot:3763551-Pyramimonas_sp.AAC.1